MREIVEHYRQDGGDDKILRMSERRLIGTSRLARDRLAQPVSINDSGYEVPATQSHDPGGG
jgi:hypothetical protein